MGLLVILSPTNKWGTKTEYTKLRKFLQKDGYIRIAPEVYMVTGDDDYQEKTVGNNCHIMI